jgi:hypothetical protein
LIVFGGPAFNEWLALLRMAVQKLRGGPSALRELDCQSSFVSCSLLWFSCRAHLLDLILFTNATVSVSSLLTPHRLDRIRALPTKGLSYDGGRGNPTHNARILSAQVEHQVEVAIPIGILNVTPLVCERP